MSPPPPPPPLRPPTPVSTHLLPRAADKIIGEEWLTALEKCSCAVNLNLQSNFTLLYNGAAYFLKMQFFVFNLILFS
jgi:hypothetical protein